MIIKLFLRLNQHFVKPLIITHKISANNSLKEKLIFVTILFTYANSLRNVLPLHKARQRDVAGRQIPLN
jgi:hypothetical protein